MTLKELSPLYLESARLISERMSLLRRQRRETDDPQERFRLERRLLELRPDADADEPAGRADRALL